MLRDPARHTSKRSTWIDRNLARFPVLPLFPLLLFSPDFYVILYTDIRSDRGDFNRAKSEGIGRDLITTSFLELFASLRRGHSLFSLSDTCNNGKLEFHIYIRGISSFRIHDTCKHWRLDLIIMSIYTIFFQTILTLCDVVACDSHSLMHVRPLFLFFIHG